MVGKGGGEQESASPMDEELVMENIAKYENFVKLKIEPKIQDLEKLKVNLIHNIRCWSCVNRLHHGPIVIRGHFLDIR